MYTKKSSVYETNAFKLIKNNARKKKDINYLHTSWHKVSKNDIVTNNIVNITNFVNISIKN